MGSRIGERPAMDGRAGRSEARRVPPRMAEQPTEEMVQYDEAMEMSRDI
jgi:hypothetical protein